MDIFKSPPGFFGGVSAKMSLSDAEKEGCHLFWSGETCKKGHLTFRYVKGGECRACVQTRNRERLSEGKQDQRAVDVRRLIEDRQERKNDEYDYDL